MEGSNTYEYTISNGVKDYIVIGDDLEISPNLKIRFIRLRGELQAIIPENYLIIIK